MLLTAGEKSLNRLEEGKMQHREESMSKAPGSYYPCPECQVGYLTPQRVSYFTMQDGHVICVPDFAAMVCDACGLREYDPDALAELHAMLETDRHSRRQTKPRRQDGERRQPLKSANQRHST